MTSQEHKDAAEIAADTGRLLLSLHTSGLADEQLRTEGDKRAHDLIINELGRRHPDDFVLSEEGLDDSTRLDRRRVWLVDPVYGTREFGELSRQNWAVHVALAIDGSPVGAVALPAAGLTLSTAEPPTLPAVTAVRPRLVVSRTRPMAQARVLAAALDAALIHMGSAGAKAMAVVRGSADVYAHSGGQYEWDSAAPVGVAAAAGRHVSRLDGSPLTYNQADPYLPDLLICRPELAERVVAVVAGWRTRS